MTRFFALFTAVFAFAVATFALPATANAADIKQYSAASFQAAQKAGKTVVVDVHADWCPTCKAQAPILSELAKDKALRNVVFMRVDFDSDKAFLREHRIPRQSTILVFQGTKETGRSIAETNRARLRSFVFGAV